MTTTAQTIPATTIATLETLEQRILWLASYMIHNANHIRENRDGLKVGGHQASSASMTTLMTVLYFHVLKPHDRVAVKPHASPVFHAIQNLMGREDIAQLQNFRSLGGAQSYPSRTKDKADVDFSTGSVGLGVAITAFASLVQDWLAARDKVGADKMGRFISLLGDAELDEGNIYEALIEAAKHDIRNTWWIVDYNRQSLDAVTPERMFARFDEIFRACGWQVDVLKYGTKLTAAFKQPGGTALFHWLEACPNDLYAVLSYGDGAGWRAQLTADIGTEKGVDALLKAHDDASLAALMTNLGGHCFETLLHAFDVASQSDAPRFMLAYTIKGRGLPFQGHKDNHAGLMNPTQVAELQKRLGVPEGAEWDALSGLSPETKQAVVAAIETAPFMAPANRRPTAPQVAIPAEIFTAPEGDKQATQAAFGKVMFEIAKSDSDFASRVITTSPDVTVSTNIGPFVNRRGIFHRSAQRDMFKDRKIASAQTWTMGADGQHIELGIAESNLFLMLCALGMSGDLFGERLFPVGTLYDPFIARGLDQLNYACYQNARFLLGSTPSGITLAAEGGAHQSINTPLIGMAQPGLTSFEPAFVDELALFMHWGFEHMQAADGGATYLRLSTRAIAQPQRSDGNWKADALKGAYWLRAPQGPCPLVIAYCGAVAPEAIAAFEAVLEDEPNAGLLAITSPGVLHADWTRAGRARWTGQGGAQSHIASLLSGLTPSAGIVTLIDGAPSALSWLGGVHGHKVCALGVEVFGQSGDQIDLYAKYRLDVEAILDAAADVMV